MHDLVKPLSRREHDASVGVLDAHTQPSRGKGSIPFGPDHLQGFQEAADFFCRGNGLQRQEVRSACDELAKPTEVPFPEAIRVSIVRTRVLRAVGKSCSVGPDAGSHEAVSCDFSAHAR
eukprot:scaffold10_cov257-Pinguiococcus_pyrenoidosus.AAC.51